MLNLAGYEESELLYSGSRTLVYRGVRIRDRHPVVVKVLRNSNPSFQELVQFRNQYIIACELEHPHIVQPLDLERHGNGYALIMPDSGAIALSQYRQSFQPSAKDILALSIQLTEALHYLSRQRIIHKDIKPANIIIHPETHHIELIDFSISSLLPKEQQQLLSPNVLEGSLSYISPEQTGRMNRGIDYRTDFYSLGVTLYELLTGKLPFLSEDPMELVHCHIAQTARFPQESNVPFILQEIVLKLMSKNAEDRYQSALGLKQDFSQCLQQLENTGELVSFVLGESDRCDRFIIPEKLYGREEEVEALLSAFNRVTQGNTEMMLVAGFSGIGKTAVINEVHKPIVKQRGYFIKGKYDQFNRNIPFSAFVQAFQDLTAQLLGESDKDLASWKAKILQVVGENGQILIEVIPELEQILGTQPPIPELEGNAAQNRFNAVFGQFVRVFTTEDHPLVIFLDDLQWADSASLNLLKLLIDESETGYLLLLGAYRDNEAFPGHPLIVQLAEFAETQAKVSTISLSNLEIENINQLIADTLTSPLEKTQSLTELVYQQARGNPFFTTQFLQGLYAENLVAFDWQASHWQWDITEIYNADLSSNVVDFMAGRLQKFAGEAQDILKLAACIGNQFDLETLSMVCELPPEQVAANLWEALQEGLILPISETYKLFQQLNVRDRPVEQIAVVGYRFLHDRVQQAAYSLIAEAKKQEIHLKIGRQLLHTLRAEDREEQLFAIVNHLNAGEALIQDKNERYEMAQLNLSASRKAKDSVAYDASRQYCYEGQKFLEKDSWERQYDLQFSLAIATIDAEHMNSNLAVAKQLCSEVLEKTKTLVHRLKVREFEITIAINENEMNQAIAIAEDELLPLGITIPRDPGQLDRDIKALYAELKIPTEDIADLAKMPEMQNEQKLAILNILINVAVAAYLAQPDIYPLLILQGVKYCLQYGNSPLAISIYTWYGSILCSYDDIEAGYAFGKLSLQLIDRFNAKMLEARVKNLFSVFIGHWKEPIKKHVNNPRRVNK